MEVDMKALLRMLESMPTNKEKEEHLAARCPCLFVSVIKQRKNIDALAEYMAKCQSCEDDWRYYTLYVHGYLLPFFDDLREEGLLSEGK